MTIWPPREPRNSRTSRLRCAGNRSHTINQGDFRYRNQIGEEDDELFLANSLLEDLEVKIPDRHCGGNRNGFPIEVVLEHRSLTTRRPGATPVGSLAQPAFVDEDDRTPFFFGFFLMVGHVLRFQYSMASSLRSRA